MSPSHQSEGIIVFERYRSRLNRPPPFLRRNLRQSLDSLTMGSSPSKVGHDVEERENQQTPERPAKRRKLGTPDVSRQAKSDRPRTLTLSPTQFYASTKANRPISRSSFVEKVRLQEPVEFRKALRIDLTQIVATAADDLPDETPYPSRMRCKCTISIFAASAEKSGSLEVLRKSQTGYMVTQSEGSDWTRHLVLPQPFVFSSDEFFVNRKKDRKRLPSQDGAYETYDLADGYQAQISVERVGEERRWPSLHVPSHVNEAYGSDILLQCRSPLLIGPERQSRAMSLYIIAGSQRIPSAYSLLCQIQWSLPHGDIFNPVHADLPIHHRVISNSSHDDGKENDKTLFSPTKSVNDDSISVKSATESPQAGGRSTRGRVVNTYNLKTLSAQAQGKSPRKRRTVPNSGMRRESAAAAGEICFAFGRADSVENGIKRQYNFDGLNCPFCGCRNSNREQFRFHLHQEHDNYKFHLRRSTPASLFFFVEVARARPSGNDGRTLQLGKPKSLFDLEKYLNGDNSWVSSRQGPQQNHCPEHLSTTRGRPSSSSSSEFLSHQSTSNTTRSEVDPANDTTYQPRKTILVPVTAKPLFHVITKQVLQPGSVLAESDEGNEKWFYQKHRDIINDFEDVDVEEKELYHKWNPFFMESQRSLTKTVEDFVERYRDWLVESVPRREKFMAHMSVLIMQGTIDEEIVSRCVRRIRDAETSPDLGHRKDKSGENTSLGSRGLYDCVCQQHVPLHDRLVCLAEGCEARYYHKACAAKLGIPEVERGKWRCNACSQVKSILQYD